MDDVPAAAWPMPRPPTRWARVACLAAVALVYLGLVIWATPFPQSLPVRWVPMAIISMSGLAGWTAFLLRPKASLALPVLAATLLLAAASLSTISSAYPSLGYSAVWHMGTVAGTGLLFWQLGDQAQTRRDLIALVTIFVVVLAGTDLAQVLALWRDWLIAGMPPAELPLRPGFVGGLVGIATWLADYLVVGAPLAVVALARTGAPGRRAAAGLAICVAAAVLVSGTRSLWILVLIGAGLLLAAGLRRRALRRRDLLVTAMAVGACAIAAAQLNVLGRISQDADEGRVSLFATALRIGSEHLLLGAGAGAYGVVRVTDQVTASSQYAFANAQNLILTTFAETGSLGIVAMIAAASLVSIQVRRVYVRAGSERPIVLASVAGLALLLGHAMVDVVVEVQGILLIALAVATFAFVTPTGVPELSSVATRRSFERTASPRLARGAAVVAVAILAVCLPFAARVETSVFFQVRSMAAVGGDPSQALADARTAADLAPDFAPAWSVLAVASDAAGRPRDGAIAAQRAFQLDGLAQHEVEAAVLLDSLGPDSGALSEIRKAVSLDPGDPFVQLNGALIMARHGAGDEAEAAFQRLLQLEPALGLAASGFPPEDQTLLETARRDLIPQLIAAGAYDTALRIALTSGDPGETDRVLGAILTTDRHIYSQIAAAWGGSQAAIRDVEGAAADARGSPGLAWWAWLLAAHRCDVSGTDRWGKVYGIRTRDYPLVPVSVGRVPSVEASMEPALYPTVLWQVGGLGHPYVRGTWVYRSGTPPCGDGATADRSPQGG